jgi:DNA repair exonuclease SbcCD ATPase subunit
MIGSILGFFTGGIGKYVIIGVLIAAVIGGFWIYQRSILSSLQDQIKEKDAKIAVLNNQIAGLIIDRDRLQASNDSLVIERDRLITQADAIRKEIELVNQLRNESEERIREFEEQARDRERQERIKKIRESEKSSLLLRFTNKNIDCFVDNFNKVNGTCIQGEFREGR